MQNVLITGASRGLGLEFARQYAQAGYRVFATCRNPDEATGLQGLLQDHAGRLHIVALDVTDEASMLAAREVVRAHGDRLDILINNAGIFAEGEAGIERVEARKMLNVYHVNVVGPVLLIKHLSEPLQNAPAPRVVNLTSSPFVPDEIESNPDPGYSYGATKIALVRVIRTLGGDLKPRNIIVIGMGPGFVLTDMTKDAAMRPTLLPPESVAGMIRTTDQLTMDDTGRIFHWEGNKVL